MSTVTSRPASRAESKTASRAARRASSDTGARALEVVTWLGLGVLVWVLSDLYGGTRGVLVWMSCLSMALGTWFFWADGGRERITAVGVYSFSFALFVGFSGLYLENTEARFADIAYLSKGMVVAYFLQVLVVAGMPRTNAPRPLRADSPAVTRWGVSLGVVLTAAGALGLGAGLFLGGVIIELSWVGILILSASLFRHRGGGLGSMRLLVAAAAFAFYVLFLFQGFGRLSLGALGLAILLAFDSSRRMPTRFLKLGTVVASVPALMIFAITRVGFTAQLNPAQSPRTTGFESVVSPFQRFAELLATDPSVFPPLRWGESFVASAVIFVPRSLWQGKPDGLGGELAHYFRPDLDGTGHSELALFHGEWLWNFGAIGLVGLVLAARFLLIALNRWQLRLEHRSWTTRRALLLSMVFLILASGLPDLLWGGTFTFMSRGGFRLFVVGVLFVVFAADYTKKRPPRRAPVTVPRQFSPARERATPKRRSPARP